MSESVTVVLTVPDEVVFDYDALLNDMYRDLLGQVKINQIFLCIGDDLFAMMLDM